jgi:hypothetical protein
MNCLFGGARSTFWKIMVGFASLAINKIGLLLGNFLPADFSKGS